MNNTYNNNHDRAKKDIQLPCFKNRIVGYFFSEKKHLFKILYFHFRNWVLDQRYEYFV